MVNLGWVYLHNNELDAAKDAFLTVATISRRLHKVDALGVALLGLGLWLHHRGRPLDAAVMLGGADSLFDQAHESWPNRSDATAKSWSHRSSTHSARSTTPSSERGDSAIPMTCSAPFNTSRTVDAHPPISSFKRTWSALGQDAVEVPGQLRRVSTLPSTF